ncbi:MAG: hypothetical protein ACE5GE_12170 [Phycisphaerae bacterium]
MNHTPAPAATAEPSELTDAATPTDLTARWMAAVAAGCLAALPIGWLLAFAALLPFYLGLFFFVLFGLILGAVVFRIGQPDRPLTRRRIVVGTACVVAVGWGTSLTTEARVFPSQVAEQAVMHYAKLPQGMNLKAFEEASTADVRRHLHENYAPGGLIGYVRWAVTSSRIDPPVGQLRKPFLSSQPRHWWLMRALLSCILLAYGVHSQLIALTRPDSQRDHRETYVNPLSKI